VLTPADHKERKEGIESTRDRIGKVLKMIVETENLYDVVRGAFRGFKSEAALAAVGDELERSQFWLTRCEMSEALGMMSQAGADKRLRERLAREKEATVVAALVDALGAKTALEAESVKAVADQLAHKTWTVPLVAARALASCGAKEGVKPLIDAMAKADGRLKNELDTALKAMTRTDMGGDASAWAEWWTANGEDFLAGRYNPSKPKRAPGAGRTTFFEMPVISRRLVIVVDRSKSMNEVPEKQTKRKIETARAEIKQLLASLPDGTRVNIVFFGDTVQSFAGVTRALDAKVRRDAAEFVDKVEPEGRTNLYDAWDKALGLVGSPETGSMREDGIDTIIIVSDGQPTVGFVTEPDVLVRRFTRENRYLRASVHTIAVGDVGTLMSKLADLNDGTSTQK
jgi:hypothetical protein